MTEDVFMPFYRDEDESWLQAAERHADNFGLMDEIESLYYEYIRDGLDDLQAAMEALVQLKIPLDGIEKEEENESN